MTKKFLILIIMLLLTGCSVNYNISINDDLKVVEKASIRGSEKLYNTYYRNSKIDVLSSLLDNYEDELKNNNYEYKLNDTNEPYINIQKEYNGIEEFLNNSKLFNDYFDEISYNKDGNIVKIETIGFNPNEEDNPERFNVDNINIAITSKYEIKNSNASKIDEDNNIYYFNLNGNMDDFKILLEIDTSKKFDANKNQVLMIIIAIAILVMSWVIVLVVNRKKKI